MDLAILGGPPAFNAPVHVGAPNIGNRQRLIERIDDALDRRWLTNEGVYARELERRLAEFMQVEHCVVVSSGMMALELMIRAAGLKGEVIVPSFTFVGTPHALLWTGITPVFCDVDPETHALDPKCVEGLITPRTTGILAVHLWGRPCDVGALSAIARKNDLKLLFDAAHAIGCTHEGKGIGSLGIASAFSFHATKCLNSLEGGAVTTQDADLAHAIRLMRNFGFADIDRVDCVGVNGKLNEFAAAMGLTSLEAFGDFVAVDRRNYEHYRSELAGVPGLRVIEYDERSTPNYHFVVLEVDDGDFGISRDDLRDVLWAENVLARRYFVPPCHKMKPYAELYPAASARLAQTERLSERVLSVPSGTATAPDVVEMICSVIRSAHEQAAEIRRRAGESNPSRPRGMRENMPPLASRAPQ